MEVTEKPGILFKINYDHKKELEFNEMIAESTGELMKKLVLRIAIVLLLHPDIITSQHCGLRGTPIDHYYRLNFFKY